MEWMSRTRMIINDSGLEKLANAHILVAGLGGVGAYAAEQLVRAGIGNLTIADSDIFHESNINRQLMALHSTMGASKPEIYAKRFLDINPSLKVNTYHEYLDEMNVQYVLKQKFDYVVDAIDTLSPKISLIIHTLKNGFPLVSSMGAGGRINPLKVEIDDFWNTKFCRLAYYLRKILRRNGIHDQFKAVYSVENVNKDFLAETTLEKNKKAINGTIPYLPPIFGCMCAAVVIKDLTHAEW